MASIPQSPRIGIEAFCGSRLTCCSCGELPGRATMRLSPGIIDCAFEITKKWLSLVIRSRAKAVLKGSPGQKPTIRSYGNFCRVLSGKACSKYLEDFQDD